VHFVASWPTLYSYRLGHCEALAPAGQHPVAVHREFSTGKGRRRDALFAIRTCPPRERLPTGCTLKNIIRPLPLSQASFEFRSGTLVLSYIFFLRKTTIDFSEIVTPRTLLTLM
jgi:hypothetical protein